MIRWLLPILLALPLSATEFGPWFTPLWEMQGRLTYFVDHEERVQSPRGSFAHHSNDHSTQFALGVTPWPHWNVELEVFMTRTAHIPYSYEGAYGTVRYQWFDDIEGDPVTLVTGVTFSFPGSRYLHDETFAYHGEVNGEVHLTVGKDWDWVRAWALAGWGIANRGNGWVHGIGSLEFQPEPFQWGVFTELLFGLGPNDIIPDVAFPGYAEIGHQMVDVGAFLSLPENCYGTLTLVGWHNVYARNFIQHAWGFALSLQIPFSF